MGVIGTITSRGCAPRTTHSLRPSLRCTHRPSPQAGAHAGNLTAAERGARRQQRARESAAARSRISKAAKNAMENQEHGRRERGVDEDRHANERPGGFERVHAFTCTRTQGTRMVRHMPWCEAGRLRRHARLQKKGRAGVSCVHRRPARPCGSDREFVGLT